ncbi:MAG: hypothetical protein HRT52_23225 [Colwellia sp.]|nr:hypothetical protein [Colwellia sp.]
MSGEATKNIIFTCELAYCFRYTYRVDISWTNKEADQRLQDIIKSIHQQCLKYGKNSEIIDYLKGANIGGFVKIADAMLAIGVV